MLGTADGVQGLPDEGTAEAGRRGKRLRRGLLLVPVLAVLWVVPSAALACDNWANKVGGSWNNAANWSEGVPTSGSDVCITKGGTYEVTLEPTEGESPYVYVKSLKVGTSSGSQKLRVSAGAGAKGAYLISSEEATVGSAGTVLLTSTAAYESGLEVQSGNKLKNSGTIVTAAGGGGARFLGGSISNTGTVELPNETRLNIAGGSTFTDGLGGTVKASGSGHLAVGGTFVQGAGTTSGSGEEPVVLEEGSTVEYAGGGASHVIARGVVYVKGALVSGETLTLEAGCAREAIVRVQTNVTNGGTIAMKGGCERYAYLEVESGTLTNKGTIKGEAGGGPLYLSGAVANEHNLELADKAVLQMIAGVFTNGTGGSVKAVGSGHLTVTGTFVQGSGTTEGPEPVVVEGGGTVEYTGGGESHVIARSGTSYLKGALVAGQTLTIEGNCTTFDGLVRTPADVTNGGTIELESTGCDRGAFLYVEGERTGSGTPARSWAGQAAAAVNCAWKGRSSAKERSKASPGRC